MTHPKQLLAHYGLSPKKSLGQNFLFDDQLLARIAATANLIEDDQVLEIGPGLGALTKHLAQHAGRVVAIELDDRLWPILERELIPYPQVTLVQGDILDADPAGWFGVKPFKVVANVPYYITGAILRHLLTGRARPTLLVLTVQKEVAQRLTASPGEMSLLAVSVQFYGEVEIVGEIKAGAFWPRPDVDSAIVRIKVRPELPVTDVDSFFRLVRAGFSQKRKQLQKNLRGLGYSKKEIRQVMETAGIDPARRAETLSIPEWCTLATLLNSLENN
jgi:16S rRNA (adenine1518-N6/adenine1519-N6)-dimethyltransferase